MEESCLSRTKYLLIRLWKRKDAKDGESVGMGERSDKLNIVQMKRQRNSSKVDESKRGQIETF